MDIKEDWFLWFTNFFHKKSKGSGVNVGLKSNKQLTEELHNQLLETFKKEPFIQDLKTIFAVLIQLIYN